MKYEFTIVANSKPLPFKTEQLISKRDIVTPEKKCNDFFPCVIRF